MKYIKTTKKFKNTKEVAEYLTKKKEKDAILPYKGGFAIVKNKRISKIFVGADALAKAKKDK